MKRPSAGKLVTAAVVAAVAAVAIVLGVLAPGVREAARRDTCRRTLRSLGLACHMYADDAGEEFPSLWQQLRPMYCDNAKLFSCPSCPSSWLDFAHGSVTERSSSYVLMPGLSAYMPRAFILIWEKPGNPGRSGVHVVRLDVWVEWWPGEREAELQTFVGLQSQAVAKWRSSGKPVKDIGEFIGPELRAMLEAAVPPPPESR